MPVVFFMISTQHLIRAGGIGSFFKGFARVAHQLGWDVTCVLDKKPAKASAQMMALVSTAKYVWPRNPQSNPPIPGNKRFGVKADISSAAIANFRQSFLDALTVQTPDLVLVNTPEAVEAVDSPDLPRRSKLTFYTHHENLFDRVYNKSGPFSLSFNDFLSKISERKRVVMATQTDFNLKRMQGLQFANSPIVLPMPIPDVEVLSTQALGSPEGILFIGRFEPRKRPQRFVDKIAATGLPAKILTNKLGVKKFEKEFHKKGITNFEIRADLTGQAKADFIASAKIAFHPSRSESYGFCAMETLAAGLPTLCLEESSWWENFANDGVHKVNSAKASQKLLELYGFPLDTGAWQVRETNTVAEWKRFLAGIADSQPRTIDLSTAALAPPVNSPQVHLASQNSAGAYIDASIAPIISHHGPVFGVNGPLQDYTQSPSLQNVALYLPAVSPAFVEPLDGEVRSIWGSVTNLDLQFLNPNSKLFYYPWCLYSAGQAAKTASLSMKDNWLTRAKADPRAVVLGDSGGFQIQQGTIEFQPETTERMLRWMERVATHSMTLDFPTGGISLGSMGPHIERLEREGQNITGDAKRHGFSTGFMACLVQSEINLAEFQRLRAPGATQLLNVIQGRNDRESQFWYNRVKTYDLEGWAFAGSHHSQLSMTLRRLIEMQRDGHLAKTKWIHFLGISTLKAGVALTYLQRALKHAGLGHPDIQLSFDSSSPTQAAVKGYQAVVGYEISPENWAFRPRHIALEDHVGSMLTIQDLARKWWDEGPDRHTAHTYIGANIPFKDLISARSGKLPTQSRDQSVLLMHHNTQAYIEGFRAVYKLLELKSTIHRIAPLRHFELMLDAILKPASTGDWAKALEYVDETADALDVFMLE